MAIHAFGPGDSIIVRSSNEWIRSELSAEHRLVDWTFHGNDGDAIRINVMKPTYLRVGGYKRIGPVPECDAIYAVRALEIGRPLSRERVGMGWHDGDNFVSKGRMIAACLHGQVPQVRYIGGIWNAICYEDEIVVPNNQSTSPNGWILPKSRLRSLLSTLRPIEPSGETATVHIVVFPHSNLTYYHLDTDSLDERLERIHSHVEYEVYEISFDTGDRTISRIWNETLEREEDSCPFNVKGTDRTLFIGSRVLWAMAHGHIPTAEDLLRQQA